MDSSHACVLLQALFLNETRLLLIFSSLNVYLGIHEVSSFNDSSFDLDDAGAETVKYCFLYYLSVIASTQ